MRLRAAKFKLVMEFKENVDFLIKYCQVPHGEHFSFRKKILLFTVEMSLQKNQLRKDEFYSRVNMLTLTLALLYEAWKFEIESL